MPSWSTTPLSFTSYAAPADAEAVTVVSVTLFATDAKYAVVSDAKAGISVTPLSESALKLASEDPSRVTVTVYVCEVTPSCAVTSTAMALPDPTPSGTTPSWSTTPLSFTSYVAPATAVAVTIVSVTVFATDPLYVVVPDVKRRRKRHPAQAKAHSDSRPPTLLS